MPLDLSFPPFDFSILIGRRRAKSQIKNRPLTLGDLLVGIAFAVFAYGPWVAGGVVGWQLAHGWLGAALGVGVAMTAQITVLALILPIIIFVESRHQGDGR